MHANRDIGAASQVAHDERDVLVGEAFVGIAAIVTKHLHFEGTVARWKRRLSEHFELRPDLLDGDVHLALLYVLSGWRPGRPLNLTMNYFRPRAP
jgi:hypothetical protein